MPRETAKNVMLGQWVLFPIIGEADYIMSLEQNLRETHWLVFKVSFF